MPPVLQTLLRNSMTTMTKMISLRDPFILVDPLLLTTFSASGLMIGLLHTFSF